MAPPSEAEWVERLLQLLHDPPGKVRYLSHHKKLAREMANTLAGIEWKPEDFDKKLPPRPDRAAAGADRPALLLWQGMSRPEQVLATHPLASGALAVQLGHGDGSSIDQREKGVGDGERMAQREAAAKLASASGDAKATYYAVWRRLRDDLAAGKAAKDTAYPSGDVFWWLLPADTRCPDVSIWDHTAVTTALAFMNVTKQGRLTPDLPAEREPHLVRFSLTPVQPFIATARTSRDYWVGSMLLAELTFAAMQPVLEAFGPTAILSPDLRANPRMDRWLVDERLDDALPEHAKDPTSFSALLPNSFTAVLPRGGVNGPRDLREIADDARGRVAERWRKLSGDVHETLKKKIGGGNWEGIWKRHHEAADLITVRWVAVPWLPGERQDQYELAGMLPFQDRAGFPTLSPADAEQQRKRNERLRPWVPEALWVLSEATRAVFGRTARGLLHSERGFDFAVTLAQLLSLHEARKAATPWPTSAGSETGVKCTLCGQRAALTNAGDAGHVDTLTREARAFWKSAELDPEGTGAERLCGICAFKRFAVESDTERKGLNKVWPTAEDKPDRDGKWRVPFPSTSAVAAQAFLEQLVRGALAPGAGDGVRAAVERVIAEHKAAKLKATQFPRCLPRLAVLQAEAKGSPFERFLEIEPQECLYPEAIEATLAMRLERKSPNAAPRKEPLAEAIRALLRAAKDELGLSPPTPRLAVVKLDGDGLGRLLGGDPEAIGARWRDVLHPETREAIEKDPRYAHWGWTQLLDTTRMSGPSLGAFISRALGEFAHRIVPWVVECEFSGRLIYAGGDDILALVPADDALEMCARLQQLYSAHWIIDTQWEADAWFWRRGRIDDPEQVRERLAAAKDRFLVPLPAPGESRIPWPPAWVAPHAGRPGADPRVAAPGAIGPVIPMLGGHQSLSAAIVYTHMKSHFGRAVHEAGRLLDDVAKDAAGRKAVAMAWWTRGDEKRQFVMNWSPGENGVPTAHHLMQRLVDAFRSDAADRLPGRLPYKLKEIGNAVAALLTGPKVNAAARIFDPRTPEEDILRQLVLANLENKPHPDLVRAVVEVWRAGWKAWRPDDPADEGWRRAADGLILARTLAEGGHD